MIQREKITEVDPRDNETVEMLEKIFGEEELLNMRYGHITEKDESAANGYILELILRRKIEA